MHSSTRFMNRVSIQQPTSNNQHPVNTRRLSIGRWMLAVGCWMFCSLFLLAGCAVGPNYRRPDALGTNAMPATYTGDIPTNTSIWKPAHPSAHLPRGDWWEVFGDPGLNRLEVLA